MPVAFLGGGWQRILDYAVKIWIVIALRDLNGAKLNFFSGKYFARLDFLIAA